MSTTYAPPPLTKSGLVLLCAGVISGPLSFIGIQAYDSYDRSRAAATTPFYERQGAHDGIHFRSYKDGDISSVHITSPRSSGILRFDDRTRKPYGFTGLALLSAEGRMELGKRALGVLRPYEELSKTQTVTIYISGSQNQ